MTRQLLTATGDSHTVGPANFCRMVGDPAAHAEVVSEVFLGHAWVVQIATIIRWTDGRRKTITVWPPCWPGSIAVAMYNSRRAARSRIPKRRCRPAGVCQGTRTSSRMLNPQRRWQTGSLGQIKPGFRAALSIACGARCLPWLGGGAVDDLRDTNPATHPRLLEQLARHGVVHDYDLRYLLRSLVTTEAYARASTDKVDVFYGHRQSRHWPRTC